MLVTEKLWAIIFGQLGESHLFHPSGKRHRVFGIENSLGFLWKKKGQASANLVLLLRFFITSQQFSSWWFQPIWKICSSKWVHLLQFSGWNFQKYLKPSTSFPNTACGIIPGEDATQASISAWNGKKCQALGTHGMYRQRIQVFGAWTHPDLPPAQQKKRPNKLSRWLRLDALK